MSVRYRGGIWHYERRTPVGKAAPMKAILILPIQDILYQERRYLDARS